MRKATVVGSLALGLGSVVACAPSGGGGGGGVPAAPTTISGVGHYDYRVTLDGAENFVGDATATFGLTASAGVYSGVVDTPSGPDNYVELTTSGSTITDVYTRDVTAAAGEGFELDTADVVVSSVTDAAECTGQAALRLDMGGAYTVDGDVSGFAADRVVWTICDPAAAAYFG